MHISHRWLLVLGVVLLAACAPGARPQATDPASLATDAVAATPSQTASGATRAANELVLWLPPDFDPDSEGRSAELLRDRIQAFEAQHPGVTVRVRIKAESGPGGLLETLSVASSVAPAALPDVIALPPAGLTAATLKGLVQPLAEVVDRPAEEAWFPYANLAAEVDGSYFGFPFASDAQVFAYRRSVYNSPPLSWSRLLEAEQPFLFPAGDPEALFTLMQYRSLSGTLAGPSGRPALDPTTLTRVLAFYGSARSSDLLPDQAVNYTNAEETWQRLLEGQAAGSVAPLSSFLRTPNSAFLSAAPLPDRDGNGVSVAFTWSWAVVSSDPERQALAADWIQFMAEPDFLGPWTEAHGLLPPSPAALDQWQGDDRGAVAALLAPTLQPRPSEEELATFGPHLMEAVQAVLTGGTRPEQAALRAAQNIQTP